MNDLLLQSCVLIFLPMIPAVILFKFLDSTGGGGGAFAGWQWKFSGAFAAYVLVFFMLWAAIQGQLKGRDVEVWTVRGNVQASQVPNIANFMTIKSVPQMLTIEADGSYEFKVIVGRHGDQLEFPRIFLDLSRACAGYRNIKLDEAPGTFVSLPAGPEVKIRRLDAARSIEIAPIVLGPFDPRKCAG